MSSSATATEAAAGRIGPNAITRLAEVLPAHVGAEVTRFVFERAGLLARLAEPPHEMVDEAEVARLHRALRATLGGRPADVVARAAGRRTADYLLAHRIPRPAQRLLRALPAPLAARWLLQAIGRHAWTFAGSGRFAFRPGRPAVVTITGNPLCRGLHADEPACGFYAAVFERLFRRLVRADAQVVETDCEAAGAAACRFELRC